MITFTVESKVNIPQPQFLELVEKLMRDDPVFRQRVNEISAKLFGEMMEEEYDRNDKYEEE